MTIPPEFDDNDLKDALGDGALPPAPSSTHINRLRLRIRDCTKQSRTTHKTSFVARSKTLVLIRVALVAGLIFVLFAIQNFSGTAAANLRTALDVTRRHVWIHSSTTITHEGETIELESWCAPDKRITAFRSPQMLHFIDYGGGIQSSYSEKSDTIFRWRAEMSGEEMGRSFINALLSQGDIKSSFPCHKVSAVENSTILEDGISKTQFTFQLELKTAPQVHWETLIRVNPTSDLIDTWEEIHSDGTRVLTRFDYPPDGPTDIFALGADRNATVIDRVASSDIVQLSREFQEQVHNFDNYEALVVDRPIDSDAGVEPLMRLIRRQGTRFSVDLLQAADLDLIVPKDVDIAWWKYNRQQFRSFPLATCDGDTCTIYPSNTSPLYAGMEMPWSSKVTTIPVIAVKNTTGETTVPVWPSLWPEYACRPFLVTTNPTLRFEIDPTGTDGPPNTQRVRLVAPDSPFSKECANYWLADDQTRCVLKSIVAIPKFDCLSKSPSEKIVVSEFSRFQKSPKGYAFATERVSSDAGSQVRFKRTFVVDFDLH